MSEEINEQEFIENNCRDIHTALFSLKAGEREMRLTDLVPKLSEKQRLEIAKMYQHYYSEEGITEDIREIVETPKLANAIIDLFTPRADSYCQQIKKRLGYFVSLENDVIFEIICGNPRWIVNQVRKRYEEIYGVSLEDDLKFAYEGDVQKDILTLLECAREKNPNPDENECNELAKELAKTDPSTWGSNEHLFDNIFASKSPEELLCIGKKYFENTGRTILDEIEEKMTGRMRVLFKELVYGTLNPAEYYAEKLRKAIKILGTDCYHLGRIITSRCEIDMPLIKKYYSMKYGDQLADDIDTCTTAYYEKLMLSLIDKMDKK